MFNKLRIVLKKYEITNLIYKFLKHVYYYLYIILNRKKFICMQNKLNNIHMKGIKSSILELINTNKSLGRFGDGEISWMLNKSSGLNGFEHPSKKLSIKLRNVITNNSSGFMIGLPDSFKQIANFKKTSRNYFIRFIVKNFYQFYPLLSKSKIYYDANVTRPYMDYINKKNSGLIFYLIKYIWNNKNILIIEGSESRMGATDDLFSNANKVKRLLCPVKNAFEKYNIILKSACNFLSYHKNYLTLISLGPTATVLSYDLFKKGYRVIDIGNIDIEYNWYLLGVNHKVNLPYQYVNELLKGQNAKPFRDKKYNSEIIKRIN